MSLFERESVNTALAACPECWTLLFLDRPCQAEMFRCPLCRSELQVAGGFVEALAYGTSNRIHHLT